MGIMYNVLVHISFGAPWQRRPTMMMDIQRATHFENTHTHSHRKRNTEKNINSPKSNGKRSSLTHIHTANE